jgi:hypothetical protein
MGFNSAFKELKDFRNIAQYYGIIPDGSLTVLDAMMNDFKVMANIIKFSVCPAVDSQVTFIRRKHDPLQVWGGDDV